MDAKLGSKNARSPDDAALPPAAEPSSFSSSPPSAAADAETRRAGDDVDDEQVERFYALLANLRALRGAFRTTAATGKRKRPAARGRGGDEPPWRPAFRMEDFETEEVGSGAADADVGTWKHKRTSCARAGSETVVAADDEEEECSGDVMVERNGPRRAAARGGALTRQMDCKE